VRILLWHVHGSWTTAFVQGGHDYLVPVTPTRDADGLGRARTFPWPENVQERTPRQLADEQIDVVVLQRMRELDLVRDWLGRRPGHDVPAIFVEHNAPEPHPTSSVHPLADQGQIPIVHVTSFNALYWDNGRASTRVVEHGVVDPGLLYSGSLARAAAVINEPVRRGRMVGADLLGALGRAAPIDLFGMEAAQQPGVTGYDDLPQHRLHRELARRRVYVHPYRWTSLGLSLIEAMHVGLPVVALAATEAAEAVPPEAGVVSTRLDRLVDGVRHFVHEPEAAREAGRAAREAALERYGLGRFLTDWDQVLKVVAG
jgi:glycosyltransferase involved in cell wall biosynthesis